MSATTTSNYLTMVETSAYLTSSPTVLGIGMMHRIPKMLAVVDKRIETAPHGYKRNSVICVDSVASMKSREFWYLY